MACVAENISDFFSVAVATCSEGSPERAPCTIPVHVQYKQDVKPPHPPATCVYKGHGRKLPCTLRKPRGQRSLTACTGLERALPPLYKPLSSFHLACLRRAKASLSLKARFFSVFSVLFLLLVLQAYAMPFIVRGSHIRSLNHCKLMA